jgi:hypothetical protein
MGPSRARLQPSPFRRQDSYAPSFMMRIYEANACREAAQWPFSRGDVLNESNPTVILRHLDLVVIVINVARGHSV